MSKWGERVESRPKIGERKYYEKIEKKWDILLHLLFSFIYEEKVKISKIQSHEWGNIRNRISRKKVITYKGG